ncbi:hypothetical protein DSLASN_40110 [Desulfoluna limicola]|uniref:DUF429 domain-containing protein n=1 Tax=Desulfoluna limicola TaxID=2810562 RepID=A0ABM7PLI3_9BACT|nr:hypothetical protein [Desulfoluna limicola]BCS98379.1 hypothetical protein DSLASN_40110 [Desulfoluna limicola]
MTRFVGIDVQVRRKCSYAVVNESGTMVDSGWFEDPESCAGDLAERFKGHPLYVGIDAPRLCMTAPRQWYWSGAKGTWRHKTPAERGWGRHCEVVIKALGLGNPQWTPTLEASPEWMLKGYSVFQAMDNISTTYEAFPTACYRLLEKGHSLPMTLDFSTFAPGPKDMLDACVLAATVRNFCNGLGSEVGGGDGLGTIILPAPVQEHNKPELFEWPGKQGTGNRHWAID